MKHWILLLFACLFFQSCNSQAVEPETYCSKHLQRYDICINNMNDMNKIFE